jgi:hypothetical protein
MSCCEFGALAFPSGIPYIAAGDQDTFQEDSHVTFSPQVSGYTTTERILPSWDHFQGSFKGYEYSDQPTGPQAYCGSADPFPFFQDIIPANPQYACTAYSEPHQSQPEFNSGRRISAPGAGEPSSNPALKLHSLDIYATNENLFTSDEQACRQLGKIPSGTTHIGRKSVILWFLLIVPLAKLFAVLSATPKIQLPI